jgi:hemerythrin-like domain-containing protein
MLRDKSLIPLSRQHQHALALCVRIERSSPIGEADLPQWRAEVGQHFEQEIRIHFLAEEQVLFPAAREFPELTPLIEELTADHEWLRERFVSAQSMSGEDLSAFARRLSNHVRKEERQLFERMQALMSGKGLADMGARLEEALSAAAQACAVTTTASRT